jgi:hypothetical protein
VRRKMAQILPASICHKVEDRSLLMGWSPDPLGWSLGVHAGVGPIFLFTERTEACAEPSPTDQIGRNERLTKAAGITRWRQISKFDLKAMDACSVDEQKAKSLYKEL